MIGERISLSVSEAIAHLELKRPDLRNGMDPLFVTEFSEALRRVEEDRTVRTLLISAAGPSFCVGGNLKYFSGRLESLEEDMSWMVAEWHTVLPRLAELPFPVVTAVHGGTAGGGLGPVWCADYVIAAESTRMAGGFADIGLSGDGGASWHLPRYVGLRRAQAMILDNQSIDAQTALDWGIVSEVVSDDELQNVAWKTAERFAQRSATAFSRAKKLLLESSTNGYVEHLQAEARAIYDCVSVPDVELGIRAFMAGETPRFQEPYRTAATASVPQV